MKPCTGRAARQQVGWWRRFFDLCLLWAAFHHTRARLTLHPAPHCLPCPVPTPHTTPPGDLAFNLALGTTLVALPLTIGAVARTAFVKYRFTDKRVSVITSAPWESELREGGGCLRRCCAGADWC
jgi:hypothetical protein